MVNCWPACAVAGQPSVACAAPLSAGRPPTAMPSVRTTPKVVTRARMSRPPSLLMQPPPNPRARWRGPHGHLNGVQVKAQLMSPTSHCAIRRASPMLQAPSRFTSHASGRVSWLHCRNPTSNWATTSASPILTTPSPFTSPQGTGASVVVVVDVVVVVVLARVVEVVDGVVLVVVVVGGRVVVVLVVAVVVVPAGGVTVRLKVPAAPLKPSTTMK